ncbi:DUF3566 domain-containing protein [Flindersiella endophytica]
MTRSGGPDEGLTNLTVPSNGPSPRQRPDQVPAGQAQGGDSGRSDRGLQRPGTREEPGRGEGRTDPRLQGPGQSQQGQGQRRDEARTEQLALDGVRPDRRLASPVPMSSNRSPLRPPGQQGRNQQERSRVRRARLRAVRLDPWSVMKTAFLLSIAFAIVTMVSVTVVWKVLEAAGVYDSVNSTVRDVLGSASQNAFSLEQYIGLEKVLGVTALICVVDVVLITAIATLGAFLYNLSASLLGGVEVTLAEEE